MREMDDQRVDLICTDPPFNSGRDYNAFLTDSLAQSKAFTDTWTWDDPAQDARADIERRARTSDTYKALDTCLKGYDLVLQNAVSGNEGAMRAYLAFMGPRLAEMHRILKDTGSIYLHCDPTASHYLKGVMDAVFEVENYRNEIVWGYSNSGRPKRFFAKKHDTILLYTKTDTAYWGNYKMPISEEYLESHYRQVDDEGRRCRIRVDAGKKRYYYPEDGMTPNDWWKDIPSLNSVTKGNIMTSLTGQLHASDCNRHARLATAVKMARQRWGILRYGTQKKGRPPTRASSLKSKAGNRQSRKSEPFAM